jgi:hypothetical protein
MAGPVSKGLQVIGLGPQTSEPPAGGSARPEMKLRFSPDQDAAVRLAWKAQNEAAQRAGAKLTLTEYVWGLFEAQQRAARAEAPASCPSFLDLAPLAAALTDLADEDNRLRSELGKANGVLLQTFGRHGDDGPAMRAAIGEALNDVRTAIGAADAACAARDNALAALHNEVKLAAERIARYAR